MTDFDFLHDSKLAEKKPAETDDTMENLRQELLENAPLVMEIFISKATGKPMPEHIPVGAIDDRFLREAVKMLFPKDDLLHKVNFTTPAELDAKTLPKFVAGIFRQVGTGKMTLAQADKIMHLTETYLRTIEAFQLREIIDELKHNQNAALAARRELQAETVKRIADLESPYDRKMLVEKAQQSLIEIPESDYEFIDSEDQDGRQTQDK